MRRQEKEDVKSVVMFFLQRSAETTHVSKARYGRKRKRSVKKNPHMEVSKLGFREMVRLTKVSFVKTQSVTYERYKLFNRSQEIGETLEAFDAALTAQAAKMKLGTFEEELVRDVFISLIQDTLTFKFFHQTKN